MNNRQKYINQVMKNHGAVRKQHELYTKVHGVVPQIYAAFALTLSWEKYGWSQDDIETLFTETMNLWEECNAQGLNMCQWCEKETGIDVEGKNV